MGNSLSNVARSARVVAVCVVGLFVGWLAFASPGAAQEAGPFAAVTLPALIEAEHYDAGADGVAYSDTDEHAGRGGFRTDDRVDAFAIDNVFASGDALLGRTRDGEFTQYTVNVAAADEFNIVLRVASGAPAPGAIEVQVDGIDVGTVDGDTNRWFDWTHRSAGTVNLEPGSHVVQLTWVDGANVNLDWIDIRSTTARCPTGTLEAEDATLSGRFEVGESFAASDGQYVHVPRGSGGWWNGQSNNYIEFCASVETAGRYRIDARLLAPTASKRSFYVQVDNGPLVDFVADIPIGEFVVDAVNDAGGLDPLRVGEQPAAIDADPMLWDLEAGDHTIRFYLRRDGAQLDNITLRSCPDCEVVRSIFTEAGVPLAADPCLSYRVTCTDDTPQTVVQLDLQRIGLTELASEIGNLTNLAELSLSGNDLTELPPEIANLSNLARLYLNGNLLRGDITQLGFMADGPGERRLSIAEANDFSGGNNCLTTTDADLAVYLNATEPEWDRCAPDCSYCRAVKAIYRANGALPGLPGDPCDSGIVLCTDSSPRTATALVIGYYRLTNLPPEIADLTDLTRIELIDTELPELPPEIGSLTNLTELQVDSVQPVAIPPEILNLTNLTSLFLAGRDLTDLLPELLRLPNLTSFGFTDNEVTVLPPEIGNLTNVTRLEISGDLTDLPSEIENLQNLTSLSLAGNAFTEVPAEISNLTNLERLNLSNNNLRELPPEIGNLTNLTRLSLSGNELVTLPPELRNLGNLDMVGLSLNQLRGDITVLADAAARRVRILLADRAGGNDCLTTTSPELAAYLTAREPGWDRCDNP